MGINTATLKFKEDLTELINNSNLPPVNVFLVLDSICKEINLLMMQQLQQEKNEEYKGE